MKQHVELRTPTHDNLSALANLGRDTFVETFGHLYTAENLNDFLVKVYSESSVAEELDRPDLHFQVIGQGDELVAYIKIGPVHVPADNHASDAMEIWQIYVRKEFIGDGFGSLLMDWAEEQFVSRGTSEVYVSVFSENPRAIRFYERYGFEKVGEYGFEIGKHIDLEWIMRKRRAV
jgi:ribosomal protein S18 acetylase RimI-like enzyme